MFVLALAKQDSCASNTFFPHCGRDCMCNFVSACMSEQKMTIQLYISHTKRTLLFTVTFSYLKYVLHVILLLIKMLGATCKLILPSSFIRRFYN